MRKLLLLGSLLIVVDVALGQPFILLMCEMKSN
jgi:hypothetical protein